MENETQVASRSSAQTRIATIKQKISNFIHNHPILTLGLFLLVIFGLIVAGNFLRQPQDIQETPQQIAKQVETFKIGEAPKVNVTGKVEKSQVITIVAQTSGVVGNFYAENGQFKEAGSWIIGLNSTYSSGNALSVQRQIAQKQYENAKDTNETQLEIIENQIKLAEESDGRTDELREISRKSASDTEDLLDLNEDILDSIEQDLEELEATNIGGINDDLILSTKQLKSQFLSAVNANKSALRNLEFEGDDDGPSADIASIQKDTTLKQLKIQKKAQELNLEIAHLQLKLAQINERLMFPSMPFAGTIQKIHVKVGDAVNPGTPLATISGANNQLTVEALVPQRIARGISQTEASTLQIGGQTVNTQPSYISTEATNGNFFTVLFDLQPELLSNVAEGQNIKIAIPIGYADTPKSFVSIPIDAVHQTQASSFVYVIGNGGIVNSKEVKLGTVTGNFVEILDGLAVSDEVITNRNIIDGDLVTTL